MRLRLLGGPSGNGNSPTLWATPLGSIVVQGWQVPAHPGHVDIPHRLLGFLDDGSWLDTPLIDQGGGVFRLAGTPVTDAEALAQLRLPEHEVAVEVPATAERTTGDASAGLRRE
ncbi:hypothetical protein ABIA39_007457 [Nocardia sp. GAS34]|uniref:hypothetical protein n=1 Tax=unclassified Nocardia TaxID=2637762 RepID=UPI003D25FC30